MWFTFLGCNVRITSEFCDFFWESYIEMKGNEDMNKIGKFEKRFGKYAIHRLPLYLIIGYAFGYLITFVGQSDVAGFSIIDYINLNPYAILHGEVWRLFTWIIVPPSSFSIFTLIMLYFYYSIGTSLERVWGAFRFNLYIFSGMLFTVIGAFLLYFAIQAGVFGQYSNTAESFGSILSYYFSTYYVNLSIILAFAATFPEVQILLMMIFPIKIKWLGVAYGAMQVYTIISAIINGDFITVTVILVSLLNFMIFFFMIRKRSSVSLKQRKRSHDFHKKMQASSPNTPKHKCVVCGRTELDGENLVFRYCSKCNGNFEYCQDHIFTHEHVK